MLIQILKETSQFGFAAVIAFIMIYLMWKIVKYGIDAFSELSTEHKKDMLMIQEMHREERAECYKKQEKQIEKFDQTINRALTKIKE